MGWGREKRRGRLGMRMGMGRLRMEKLGSVRIGGGEGETKILEWQIEGLIGMYGLKSALWFMLYTLDLHSKGRQTLSLSRVSSFTLPQF